MLKDFLGFGEYIDGIGNIYPIKIIEYEHFQKMANKYIVPDKYVWEEKLGKELNENIYDVLFHNLILFNHLKDETLLNVLDDKTKQYMQQLRQIPVELRFDTEEFAFLLELILHEKVEIDLDLKIIRILNEEDKLNTYEINKDNFELFREKVMYQNLLFAPLHYDDVIMQSILESKRRKRVENSNTVSEIDIESMVQTICIVKGVTPNSFLDYTYYQLMAEYNRVQHLESYDWTKLIQTSGFGSENTTTPQMAKMLDLHKHPETPEYKNGGVMGF